MNLIRMWYQMLRAKVGGRDTACRAIYRLERLGDRRAIGFLKRRLVPGTAERAAAALAAFGERSAAVEISDLLDSTAVDAYEAWKLVESLGRLGDRAAIKSLKKVILCGYPCDDDVLGLGKGIRDATCKAIAEITESKPGRYCRNDHTEEVQRLLLERFVNGDAYGDMRSLRKCFEKYWSWSSIKTWRQALGYAVLGGAEDLRISCSSSSPPSVTVGLPGYSEGLLLMPTTDRKLSRQIVSHSRAMQLLVSHALRADENTSPSSSAWCLAALVGLLSSCCSAFDNDALVALATLDRNWSGEIDKIEYQASSALQYRMTGQSVPVSGRLGSIDPRDPVQRGIKSRAEAEINRMTTNRDFFAPAVRSLAQGELSRRGNQSPC